MSFNNEQTPTRKKIDKRPTQQYVKQLKYSKRKPTMYIQNTKKSNLIHS